MLTKRCLHCQEEFTAKRADALYCSHSCRQMAYKKKTDVRSVNLPVNTPSQASILPSILSSTPQKSVQKSVNIPVKPSTHPSISEPINEEIESFRRQTELIIEENAKNHDEWMRQNRINSVNRQLKTFIEKLLALHRTESTIWQVKRLFKNMLDFPGSWDYCQLPEDYPHRSFIEDFLVPKVKEWNQQVETVEERTITFNYRYKLKTCLQAKCDDL